MAITFSFKDKKKMEQEKYDYPVLTQKPYDEVVRGVAKFAMNKAMLTQMGYPKELKGCKISIARDDESNEILLINSTGIETANQYNVNADGTFNSKFLLGRIKKSFSDINSIEGYEFHNIGVEQDDENTVMFTRIYKKQYDEDMCQLIEDVLNGEFEPLDEEEGEIISTCTSQGTFDETMISEQALAAQDLADEMILTDEERQLY